jgi:RNA polymerase sigma-70 factor (sigma-E family)
VHSRSETTAFGAFYESSYPQLVRVATAIVGDRRVAEEIVQDAFAATWPRRDSVIDLAPYLRRAVVNGCRSHLRRRRDFPGRVPDIAEVDVHPELVASLKRLNFQQRSVLVLRYYEDLADDEIGRALGIRPNTVRSTASRALAALREVLRDVD